MEQGPAKRFRRSSKKDFLDYLREKNESDNALKREQMALEQQRITLEQKKMEMEAKERNALIALLTAKLNE